MCPALAEVINLCDALLAATSVSAGLASSLGAVAEHLQSKGKQFEYALHMEELYHKLASIRREAKALAESKRQAVEESNLIGPIFAELTKQSGSAGKPTPNLARLAALSG